MEPLDEMYFKWLYGLVNQSSRNPSPSYWRLFKKLHCKEFVWVVPNDDNRLEDGKELRYAFIDDVGLMDVDLSWVNLGCSMLELFIGLSRRLSFEAGGEPREWFWRLMTNLHLEYYSDNERIPENEIDEILDRVIWRTYDWDGQGGLFPLKFPTEDQRHVELWYQLNAYVMEMIP